MVESDEFPYVEGKHGAESREHVKLKGLAVYWLLQRGFELGDIEEEHPVDPPERKSGSGNTRYVDVYAEQDGTEVYIECERGSLTFRSVSLGGTQKAKNGETVFVFGEDGIYRFERQKVTPEGTDVEMEGCRLNRISNLPVLDLSAFS